MACQSLPCSRVLNTRVFLPEPYQSLRWPKLWHAKAFPVLGYSIPEFSCQSLTKSFVGLNYGMPKPSLACQSLTKAPYSRHQRPCPCKNRSEPIHYTESGSNVCFHSLRITTCRFGDKRWRNSFSTNLFFVPFRTASDVRPLFLCHCFHSFICG